MRCLITLIFAFCLTHAHAADHAAMIQSLGEYDAKAGAKLYELQVVTRDLDTIFREVNDNGD